jgi:hypothetical protein
MYRQYHKMNPTYIEVSTPDPDSRYTYISMDSEFAEPLCMVTVATPVAVSRLVVTKSSGDGESDDTDEKRMLEQFWIPSASPPPPLMKHLA